MINVKKSMLLLLVMSIAISMCSAVYAKEVEKITVHTVNINKADIDELVLLDRVGKGYAKRIVDYRTKNGPFKTPEEITRVKGIGPKILEANKGRIVVK